MQGFQSHREFTGREPDAVVFSSFLWDMQRWGKFFPEKLTERGLSTEMIEEWAHNLEAVFALIKVIIMLSNLRPGAWAHLAHCHVCHMPACFNASLAVIPRFAPVQPPCKQCLYSAELRISLLYRPHDLHSICNTGQEGWRSCGSQRATKS